MYVPAACKQLPTHARGVNLSRLVYNVQNLNTMATHTLYTVGVFSV